MIQAISHHDRLLYGSLLAVGASVAVILFGLLLVFFKNKLTKSGMRIMYSWTAGFIGILAMVGLWGEAFEMIQADHYAWGRDSANQLIADGKSDEIDRLGIKNVWTILIIVGTLIFTGILLYILERRFASNNSNVITDSQVLHGSESQPVKKSIDPKWKAIIVLIFHRIPEGLSMGFILYHFDSMLGLLIVMAIHIFPEKVIIFYRLRSMKIGRWKAFFISSSKQLLSMVFKILGVFLAFQLNPAIEAHNSFWFVMPVLFILAGTMMAVTMFFEISPEFTGKNFKGTHIFWFFIGITMAATALSLGA